MLARALHEWIGPESKLISIYSTVGSDVLHPDEIPQHVVVQVGVGCYLDGNGASTEPQLLRYWASVEGLINPELRPANAADLVAVGIQCPSDRTRDLVDELSRAFGPGNAILMW